MNVIRPGGGPLCGAERLTAWLAGCAASAIARASSPTRNAVTGAWNGTASKGDGSGPSVSSSARASGAAALSRLSPRTFVPCTSEKNGTRVDVGTGDRSTRERLPGRVAGPIRPAPPCESGHTGRAGPPGPVIDASDGWYTGIGPGVEVAPRPS